MVITSPGLPRRSTTTRTTARRSGQVAEIESTRLVPGDVVLLEAGDVVPADGRIISSATLEVQEATRTGESAPLAKDAGTLPAGEVALGDRTNLVFQNTQVTRGTATFVVTGTGSATQMGQIAGMVTATKRSRSPLQRELDGMTKVFGTIAFAAVAVIAIFGLVRAQDTTVRRALTIRMENQPGAGAATFRKLADVGVEPPGPAVSQAMTIPHRPSFTVEGASAALVPPRSLWSSVT
jgi:magnesium-transporting ATPase (P-type)